MTEQKSLRDPLTGALLRTALREQVQTEIDRARQQNEPLTLIFIDLDHFKSVNDAFGHQRGDQVLIECVHRLQAVLPSPDQIYRYGGDEFVLVLPHIGITQAHAIAERLLERVHSLPFPGNPPIRTTASLGLAVFPQDGETAEALFAVADARHYAAKRAGRDRIVADASLPTAGGSLTEAPRVLERDEELRVVHEVLAALGSNQHALIHLHGPRGSGRTRFLAEASRAARLHGFLVLNLVGTPSLRRRAFGSLLEGLRHWDSLPSPAEGIEKFTAVLQRLLSDKQAPGLMITVDNLRDLDSFSLEALHHLFAVRPSMPLVLIYTATANSRVTPDLPVDGLERNLTLQPLSPRGVQVWLRSALRWEPPASFVAWLHREAQGLPALLERGLQGLLAQGLLATADSGWSLLPGYEELSLQSLLAEAESLTELPAPTTSFIGREREIRLLKQRLAEQRLVTIMGPGGIGKTRLAVQVAAELAAQVRDGAFFVPLAPVSSPDLIIPAIAAALRVPLNPVEPPAVPLFRHLRDREILLVLDNLEHLIDGIDLLSDLLESAPRVRILTTSRERLHLRGEALLVLDGLQVPSPEDAGSGRRSCSILLFAERARLLDHSFTLTAENLPHVTRICQMVRGMPLGVELAAAWVRVISCQEIADSMAQHLDFLTTRGREVPERHRSLRSVFAHSWDRLSPKEQQAFARLSVFRGGFSREAAAAVADAGLPILTALLDKSLLRRSESGRFEAHELLRQYAAETLDQPTLSSIEQAHATYMLTVAEKYIPNAVGPRHDATFEHLTAEHDNLRIALEWALSNGQAELALRISGLLWQFWWRRGHLTEGLRWLRRSLTLDETTSGTEQRKHARAAALFATATLLLESGEPQALGLATDSIRLFRELADEAGAAHALITLGHALRKRGSYVDATCCFEESLTIWQGLSDAEGISAAWIGLGLLAVSQGDYPTANERLTRVLTVQQQVGNQAGLALAKSLLGTAAMVAGEHQRAESLLREALDLTPAADVYSRAMNLSLLGELAVVREELHQAKPLLMEALALKRQAKLDGQVADTLLNLGCLARRTGSLAEGRMYCREVLSFLSRGGDRRNAVNGLILAASIAAAVGEPRRACRLLGAADSASAEIGYVINLAFQQEYLELKQRPEVTALTEEYAEGHRMGLDEAITYALSTHVD